MWTKLGITQIIARIDYLDNYYLHFLLALGSSRVIDVFNFCSSWHWDEQNAIVSHYCWVTLLNSKSFLWKLISPSQSSVLWLFWLWPAIILLRQGLFSYHSHAFFCVLKKKKIATELSLALLPYLGSPFNLMTQVTAHLSLSRRPALAKSWVTCCSLISKNGISLWHCTIGSQCPFLSNSTRYWC